MLRCILFFGISFRHHFMLNLTQNIRKKKNQNIKIILNNMTYKAAQYNKVNYLSWDYNQRPIRYFIL